MSALNSLTLHDFRELKFLTKTPAGIFEVMLAVRLLLGENSGRSDWKTASKVRGDSDFLGRLMDYDKDSISPIQLGLLNHYTSGPLFNPQIMAKKSRVAMVLCMWCCAMDTYCAAKNNLKPKKAWLAAAKVFGQHHG